MALISSDARRSPEPSAGLEPLGFHMLFQLPKPNPHALPALEVECPVILLPNPASTQAACRSAILPHLLNTTNPRSPHSPSKRSETSTALPRHSRHRNPRRGTIPDRRRRARLARRFLLPIPIDDAFDLRERHFLVRRCLDVVYAVGRVDEHAVGDDDLGCCPAGGESVLSFR